MRRVGCKRAAPAAPTAAATPRAVEEKSPLAGGRVRPQRQGEGSRCPPREISIETVKNRRGGPREAAVLDPDPRSQPPPLPPSLSARSHPRLGLADSRGLVCPCLPV